MSFFSSKQVVPPAAPVAVVSPPPTSSGALQDAMAHSAHFACIATDERGVIQVFNAGAERMFGHSASEVIGKKTPADFRDPLEVSAQAKALSKELRTTIAPGFG